MTRPIVIEHKTPLNEAALLDLINACPKELHSLYRSDIRRVLWQIRFIIERMASDIDLMDVGGGTSLFPVVLGASGIKTTVVDWFETEWSSVSESFNREMLERVFPQLGIRAIHADVVHDQGPFMPNSVDVITSFDSMEHWHDSPKATLHAMTRALRSGGLFFLGVPNCVNIRKRVTVPLGYGKWSDMTTFYEQARFFGHVREYDVDDLLYIARDLDLSRVEIIGKNWMGYANHRQIVRTITPFVDRLLQFRPGLCSDIYLVGYR